MSRTVCGSDVPNDPTTDILMILSFNITSYILFYNALLLNESLIDYLYHNILHLLIYSISNFNPDFTEDFYLEQILFLYCIR